MRDLMRDHIQAAELEDLAATLEAEAAALAEQGGIPAHCSTWCTDCGYKARCDEVTSRIGKAYVLRQRAANLRR